MISKIYSGIEVKCNEEDLNKKGVIYCLNFENGKNYIGQTTLMLSVRVSSHCQKSNKCDKLKNAINKYKTFTVSILESNLTLSQLNSFEKFYIKLFNSNGDDGYNLDSGGMNKTHSDETKRKISESHKGKTLSDEHIKKLSKLHKGVKQSDESKSKKSLSLKGRFCKKIKSIPDDIIFNSVLECAIYYRMHRCIISRYFNGKVHKKSGQTFVTL